MKLNIDLGYIFKRLIVIVLGFLLITQLKSCDVFAMTSIDISNYWYNNCRGFYLNNGTYTGVYGTVTLDSDILPNENYCKISNWNTYPVAYFNFLLNKNLMGADAINFEVGKKYNLYFNVRTVAMSPGSIGPNNVTGIKVGFYTDLNAQYNVSCDVTRDSGTYYESYLNNNNYSVVCRGLTLGEYTSWTNLRFFIFVDNYNNGSYPNSFSFLTTLRYEEDITVSDVNESLNSSDVTESFTGAGTFFGGTFENDYGLQAVILAPLDIVRRATDTCSPLSFTIFQKSITLPCGTDLFWEKDFSNYPSIFTHGSDLNSTRNTFRAFWNMFFGGAIILALSIKLYMVIQKAFDPYDDTLYTVSDAIDTHSESGYVPRHAKGSYVPRHAMKDGGK